MSVTVTVNATSYTIPQTSETNWGAQVTAWIQAVSQHTLQKTGGNFTLTNELDFGSTYGVKSAYFKSRTSNVADAGTLRLAGTDSITWRNIANAANLSLKPSTLTDGILTYNSIDLVNVSDAQTLTNKSIDASSNSLSNISNGSISSSASIALSKLAALSLSKVLVSDGSGVVSASSVSSTTLAFLDATSSVQTQINSKASSSSVSTHTGASSGIHGVTGNVVGTSDSQTLSNKTLTSPTISQIVNTGTLTLPTSTDTLIGKATTDTLTNKTINGSNNTITNVSLTSGITGTLPIANGGTGQTSFTTGDILYASGASTLAKLTVGTSGQVLTVSSGQPVWAPATGGSGSGGINYISNYSAEVDTSGWVTYANGAAVPTTGTGGTPTATFTRSTTSPLRGTASFLYTAGALGNGTSYAFTIDPSDQAKSIQIGFDWAVTGTTASGDYTVYVYDITNSVLTQVSPYQLPGGISTTQYNFKGSYQTASNSTSYRLIIHQAVATPGGNLKPDNIYFGPQGVSYSSPMSDWQSYVPTITGFGTPTGVSFQSRRVGDSLEVHGVFTAGTTTAVQAQVTLGFSGGNGNVTIDTTKIQATGIVGSAAFSNFAASLFGVSPLATGANNYIGFGYQASAAGESNAANASSFLSAGQVLTFNCLVPIAGWGSSSAISQTDSSEGRVVALYAHRNGVSQTMAPNASAVQVQFNSVAASGASGFDTLNGFDTGTYTYTCKVPGYYRVSSQYSNANPTNVLNNRYFLQIMVGGVERIRSNDFTPAAATTFSVQASGNLKLSAGDTITVYLFGVGNNSVNTLSMDGGAASSYLTLEKISGNQSITSAETVAARYVNTSTQSIPTGANTIVTGWTRDNDSHGMVNTTTGAITIPVSGRYRISAVLYWNILSAGVIGSVFIRKNATSGYALLGGGAAGGADWGPGGSQVFSLLAGDVLYIEAYQTAGTAKTLISNSGWNAFSINRIGN